jgi:hypothetical protein
MAAALTRDPTTMTDQEILDELTLVADELDRIKGLYRRRHELFLAGRNREPKLTQAALAAAARVNPVQVIETLRKPLDART